MDTFCENLAHFIHGAAFMFFILASIQLYPLRHRSNMMRLLFCSMIFLAFLEFKDMGFVRAHLSFLVNMKYITQISSYVMTLTTGKKIPVPKARYAQVKREYMLYKGEE